MVPAQIPIFFPPISASCKAGFLAKVKRPALAYAQCLGLWLLIILGSVELLATALPPEGLFAASSGVFGSIKDRDGTPLPFANVFVEGSAKGCASNLEGDYALDLEPGSYTLVARYLGYTTQRIPVSIGAQRQRLDFVMEPETLTLKDVLISGTEDPALEIMRKAIAKREEYQRETRSFSTEVYIKGMQRIDQAPDKIFGISLNEGAFGESLDSNNSGIIYLSESFSRLHVRDAGRPNVRMKEEMLGSKVSGDDQAFSFNEAGPMEMSFYQPRLHIGGLSERNFISPLANDAFFFYRFSLAGTFYESGNLINKIEVSPRREHDPVFRGHIYIVEDSWRTYGTDLMLTRNAGIEFVDSLRFQMTYSEQDSARWMPVSRQFSFRFGILGIKGRGYFMAFYNNYVLEPEFARNFFGPEVLAIREGANEQDSAFWTGLRPIPLSPVEISDYHRKDSLAELRKDQTYMDSLDRIDNQWTWMNALLGYSHSNTFKKSVWYWNSPLNTISFNSVEGWYGEMTGGWRKEFEQRKSLRIHSSVRYGTSNGRLQADARIIWNNKPYDFQRFELAGGKAIRDYHPGAISPMVNSGYTLLLRENYLKLYEVRYVELKAARQLFNGMRATVTLHRADRIGLRNTADPSWITFRDKELSSNDPLDPIFGDLPFEPHSLSYAEFNLRYQIAEKFASEPNRRYIIPSGWPVMRVNYRHAFPVLGSELSFARLEGGMEYSQRMGLLGQSDFAVSAGAFVLQDSLQFADFKHFGGNQTIFLNSGLQRFNVLPYFARSSAQPWAEFHWEHHFNGFVFNKIPGFRKLRWQLVSGGHALYTQEHGWYGEGALGIEHIFKVLRVEFAAGWGEGEPRYGVLVGLGF